MQKKKISVTHTKKKIPRFCSKKKGFIHAQLVSLSSPSSYSMQQQFSPLVSLTSTVDFYSGDN